MWRLFNHCGVKSSNVSPKLLLNIFRTWIMPHFETNSEIWILLVVRKFSLIPEIENGYGILFKELSSLYDKCLRAILGLEAKAYKFSPHIILGMLPLHCHLLIRSLSFYHRIVSGQAGPLIMQQHRNYMNQPWEHSLFFGGCISLLEDIQNSIGCNILCINNSGQFKRVLKDGIFKDLDVEWKKSGKASFLQNFIQQWGTPNPSINVANNRQQSILFSKYISGTLATQQRLYKLKLSNTDICSTCKRQETQQHLLFHCNRYNTQRKQLYKSIQATTSTNPNHIFNIKQNISPLQLYLLRTIGRTKHKHS